MKKIIKVVAVVLVFYLFFSANNSGAQLIGDSPFNLFETKVTDILSELNKQIKIMEDIRQTKNDLNIELKFILRYIQISSRVAVVILIRKTWYNNCRFYFVLYKFQDKKRGKKYWGFSEPVQYPLENKNDVKIEMERKPLIAIDAGLNLKNTEFHYLLGIAVRAVINSVNFSSCHAI